MVNIILILVAIISVCFYGWWIWKRRIKRPKKNLEKTLEEAMKLGLITIEEFLRLKSDRANEELKEYLKAYKK